MPRHRRASALLGSCMHTFHIVGARNRTTGGRRARSPLISQPICAERDRISLTQFDNVWLRPTADVENGPSRSAENAQRLVGTPRERSRHLANLTAFPKHGFRA